MTPALRQRTIRQISVRDICDVRNVKERATKHGLIGEFPVGGASGRAQDCRLGRISNPWVVLEPVERGEPGRERLIGIKAPVGCDPCFSSHQVYEFIADVLPGCFWRTRHANVAFICADGDDPECHDTQRRNNSNDWGHWYLSVSLTVKRALHPKAVGRGDGETVLPVQRRYRRFPWGTVKGDGRSMNFRAGAIARPAAPAV